MLVRSELPAVVDTMIYGLCNLFLHYPAIVTLLVTLLLVFVLNKSLPSMVKQVWPSPLEYHQDQENRSVSIAEAKNLRAVSVVIRRLSALDVTTP